MTDLNQEKIIEDLLHQENEKTTKLPISKVRKIMKTDPEVHIVSNESVFLVTRATELFLKNIAQESYGYTKRNKRKTMQRKDIDLAIENIDALCFLEGALD